MRLRPVLGRLFSGPARRRSKRLAKQARRLRLATLEDRTVPAYLFVDFGDNFPGGTLTTTQGAFRDVAGDPTPANRVLGTTLADGAGGFNAGTRLDIVAQTFSATARQQMMDVVRRDYLPLNVTVVDLTANVQTTPDGRNVRGAASMADVINTLRAGDPNSRDAYVFVATFNVDPGGANPATYGPGGGGKSPGGPNGTTLDTTDLAAAANVHDDVVAVYSGGGFNNNTLNNIAHEAGHSFGLQHSITNATGTAGVDLFHQAEIMSYLNTNATTSSAFTRYPMIRGDDNSPGGPLVSYNDLAARAGQVTLYDQLRLDGNVGPNPAYSFVSGTGANDIITITRNGTNADVSVQAFSDAAYTTAITVPGEADTTYSYSFPLSNTILIYAGDSNDRIVLDGDLGVPVQVDGMLGTDALVVNGKGAATAYYTPDATSPTGVDRNTNFGGTLAIDGTWIQFEDFETAGSVTVQNVGTLIYTTPAAGADNLTASRNAGGTPQVTGTVNDGTAVVPLLLPIGGPTGVGRLAVNTGVANDTFSVDSGNGPVAFPNGIDYDGGSGFDRLNLTQTGGTAALSGILGIGAANGSGQSITTFAAGTQTINFENLEPVTDTVPAATFSITSVPGLASLLQTDNTITYQGSLLLAGGGRVTVDTFEPIEFRNKLNLTIDAGAGADTVDLVNAGTPTGLTSMTVNAGSGDDTVTAAANAATPGLVVNGGLGNDYLSADGDLNGDGGNDILIGGAGDNALSGGDGEDILDGRGGSNSLDGGAGTDTILVSGTAGADTITTTHGAGTFGITGGPSAGNNSITDMEAVRVEAGDGADAITLNLSAAGGLNYTVLGGNPIGTLTGDSLTVNSSAAMTVTAGPENDAGSVDAATATPTNVSFDEIEKLILTGGGGGVVNGTNGDDAITVIARDSSYDPAADGVQDFTAVVNGGLEILYLNQPTLAVNALGGSDTIVIRTPAPNNAVWDVDVTVDGGPPSAGTPGGSDRLVVETPGPTPETAVYTPSAADAGTLNLTSLSSLITMTQLEELLYDGEADNDTLTIAGTAGPNTFFVTPGATPDAGTLAMDATLPISFQNLGAGAAVNVAGNGGANTLVYYGTAANDAFLINSGGGGVVTLNNRLPVNATGVATFRAEGFAGDDTFTLVPAISASPFTTLLLNGGDQASATGDQTNLKGTASPDAIGVSGQVVTLGGVTVASSGVENINLDSGGGVPPDTLTYTGVAGVTEAVSLAGSSTKGAGVLSVPGVVNLTFLRTEQFVVNGQPADVDTLTVVGTNAVDRININLAAAGTVGDPVLKLLNAAGTLLELTLLNYTGFNVLNVNALDGNDVVNVYTAATIPGGLAGRNVFVDGGQPTGKNKGTDVLNVYYAGKRPRIVHSATTQSPDDGLNTLDYGTAFFSVQYGSMELVNILKS